ncbi:MAG: hypothetical protein RQ826_16275 [Xanthomonadales bacterium]|nr:hypothetical protein [Xanthomonadales bacterium]
MSRGFFRVAACRAGLCALLWLPLAAWAQEDSRAVLEVDLQYETQLLEQVEAELLCSSGEPGRRHFEWSGTGVRSVAVQGFRDGQTNCQLRALTPVGYSAAYAATSPGVSRTDENGCQFARISAGDALHCRIEVSQDPVTITVYKKWLGASGEEDDVRISLECESGEYSGVRYINDGSPDGWQITGVDPEGVLCNVYEAERETYRPDIIDCQGLLIRPGKGEECTMVNTKIVKRIEVLNRYGRAIMILVMLVAGLIAVRRFV